MKQYTFSIVIPTFKRKEVLSRTLRQLDIQKCNCDFEVIVINDGPAEELPELGFGKGTRANWRLIQNPHNLGRAATRNRGIKEAAGEYVLMLDDDIWAVPGLVQAHYEKQMEIGGGVVVGAVPPANEIENTVWHRYLQERYQRIEKRLHDDTLSFSMFFTGNVSIPHEIIKKHEGFNEMFTKYSYEDTELGYRLFRAGIRFAHAKGAIGYHVLHESFESLKTRALQSGQSIRVFMKLVPEAFDNKSIYSCAIKHWQGGEIIKNILKMMISSRVISGSICLFVKVLADLHFDRVVLKILPYMELSLQIRGSRGFSS